MSGVAALLAGLRVRAVDDRYDAVDEIRDAVMGIREALHDRLSLEKNELVLVSILQVLQELTLDGEVLKEVRQLAIADRRVLVRAAAISAIGNPLSCDQVDFFLSRLLVEKNPRVRLELLLGLFDAGFRGVLDGIIGLMKATDYHTQCAAIHGLLDTSLGDREKRRVVEVLKDLVGREPRAVATTAKTAIDELTKNP